MNYFFNAARTLYSQLTARNGYEEYDRRATLRRVLRKPGYLAQVSAARIFRGASEFEFNGSRLRYFHHFYNNTSLNERTIEIPIARHFLRPGLRTLEIGNVLNHYGAFAHDVVDRYEKYPGIINEDIVSFQAQPYDVVIAISTLEHLGWDEAVKDPEKPLRAIEHIRRQLLAPAGTMVITVPHGENPYLDSRIDEVECNKHYRFQRFARFTGWRQVNRIDPSTKYGWPYLGANALHVLVFEGRKDGPNESAQVKS
ncbi:MAG TPA: hypothetical protein VFL42_11620 [Terriglobales bacterium]|jgi:hypothetical protein|nr:hypothetical protein [Terriglobales bacterium]